MLENEFIKKLLYTKVNITRTRKNTNWLCSHIAYVFKINKHHSITVALKTKQLYQIIVMNYDDQSHTFVYIDNDNNTILEFSEFDIQRQMNANDHLILEGINSPSTMYELQRMQNFDMLQQYFLTYRDGKYIKGMCEYSDKPSVPQKDVSYANETLRLLSTIHILEENVFDLKSLNDLNLNFGSIISLVKAMEPQHLSYLNTIQYFKIILKEHDDIELLQKLIDIESQFLKNVIVDLNYDYTQITEVNNDLTNLMKFINTKYEKEINEKYKK